MKKHSILIIIPYFGKWPEWYELFVESCKHNPDINWLIYTDCTPPHNKADNIEYVQLSFIDYCHYVSSKLNIQFNPKHTYKLCDLKPALGHIHQDAAQEYDFYGFGDIDVIYGNISEFLTNDILEKYDVIGTHEKRLSGHFCLFRNNERNRLAYKKIKNWKYYLSVQDHTGFDESKFSKLFVRHRNHPQWLRKLWTLSSRLQRKVYFREQYSTILSPIKWIDGQEEHPEFWYWTNGRLFNSSDEREFMYLHFMNWKSNKPVSKKKPTYRRCWRDVDRLINVSLSEASENGFEISPKGFTPLKQSIKDKLTQLSNSATNNLYLLLCIITLQ